MQAKVFAGAGGAAAGDGLRHLPPGDAAPQAGGQAEGPQQLLQGQVGWTKLELSSIPFTSTKARATK